MWHEHVSRWRRYHDGEWVMRFQPDADVRMELEREFPGFTIAWSQEHKRLAVFQPSGVVSRPLVFRWAIVDECNNNGPRQASRHDVAELIRESAEGLTAFYARQAKRQSEAVARRDERARETTADLVRFGKTRYMDMTAGSGNRTRAGIGSAQVCPCGRDERACRIHGKVPMVFNMGRPSGGATNGYYSLDLRDVHGA